MSSLVRSIVFLALLSACAEPQGKPAFPFRALIVASDAGQYRAKEVTFETLDDLDHMSGRIGYLRGNASLNVDEDPSEIIASADPDSIYTDRGHKVKTDYLVEDGVVVPQNFQTMEMLGLYYNVERTIRYWETNLDLPLDEIGYPSLFYNPKLSSNEGGIVKEVSAVMNAAYLSGVRDLWFFKTSPQERIPVKMNFGVVAHEFGHFVFDYRFANLDTTTYETSSLNNQRLLSGINEGLADFFAYMVTGSPREYAASLPELAVERSLPVGWTYNTLPNADCNGGFYCEGSILASMLYEIVQSPGQSAEKVGKVVYDSLPLFRTTWLQLRNKEILDSSSFLRALIETAGADKAIYCATAVKWYDSEALQRRLSCS
jgi:hypothetical protein